MISLVINCDTRPGLNASISRIGDDGGQGSLHGCRHADFLTDGILNKIRFLRGHQIEVIVYIDEHEPLPPPIRERLTAWYRAGIINQLVCKPHDRRRFRWYDHIYLDALALATGEYVCHFDQDTAALAAVDADPVADALRALDKGECDFVCQPSALADHGMWWASTRFFISRSLDVPELRRCLDHDYLTGKIRRQAQPACCLEQTLGKLAGLGRVRYPVPSPHWLVWHWAHYHAGTLAWLNWSTYEEAYDYLMRRCGGLHGANDVIGQPVYETQTP